MVVAFGDLVVFGDLVGDFVLTVATKGLAAVPVEAVGVLGLLGELLVLLVADCFEDLLLDKFRSGLGEEIGVTGF